MTADRPELDDVPSGWLGWIERVGNRLPDPATLFLLGTLAIMVASAAATWAGLEVQHVAAVPVTDAGGATSIEWRPVFDEVRESVVGADGVAVVDAAGEPVTEAREVARTSRPQSLLSRDGIFWLFSSMVKNFTGFAPLGVVLVGMLGIGLAERVGLMAVLIKVAMQIVPARLLTPALVFAGVMSSLGVDAGYIVLPPLAVALYRAAGRSPLAGLAAVTAGVGAGFNANLFITGLDPMLAGFATTGAQVLDPSYVVSPACNWYFMIASTFLITLAGWWTTARFVERRLAHVSPERGGPVAPTAVDLAARGVLPEEARALRVALAVMGTLVALTLAAILVPGAPLHGDGNQFDRWVESIVPLLFVTFAVPSIVYGVHIGRIRSDKDASKMLVESIAAMAPIIVLSFFAAQFIEAFKYSGLDRMLALWGGQHLGRLQLPNELLILAFIGVVMSFNLMMASMSAKYAMLAPIFIPMFMMVGISPELTQAAYRIGDSVTNTITPLNAYLVILLVFMRQFVPRAGMGTLISTMLPYSLVFAVVWPALLLVWMLLGLDLGPDGPLGYAP
jgi:aminobenzoyl-glutamate transport protein